MKKVFLLLALVCFFATGCTTPGKKTAYGTGIGAAAGAGLGAIIGSASGNAGKGALIGAAAGALLGGTIGNRLDKQAQELAQIAETQRTERGILVSLKGDILFDSGKANLKPESADRINKIGKIIAKYPEDRVVVVGHTDNVGSNTTNQQLSENRAKAVKVHLLTQGVPEKNITTIGMGESQPFASNAAQEGRAQNRRVELKITMLEE